MHWALVAHRDQRDVNLSSLRMLVVADGSNPCKIVRKVENILYNILISLFSLNISKR